MLERSFEADARRPGPLRRRFRRLLQMSASEIAYRASERVRIEADRRRCRRGAFGTAPVSGFKEYLRDVMAPRFLFAPGDAHRAEVAAALVSSPECGEAEALLAHRVPLLGFGVVDLGPTIDWHRDPVTGERWAMRFFADYDLVKVYIPFGASLRSKDGLCQLLAVLGHGYSTIPKRVTTAVFRPVRAGVTATTST